MNSFLKQLQDFAISRVKNTLFLTFIISWATVNFDFSLTLLFSDINIEEKIKYIKSFPYTLLNSFVIPVFLTTVFYPILLPLLNLLLTIIKDKTVNQWVLNHKNKTLINYYKNQRDVEIEKIKTNSVAKEYELRLKKEELELEKENIDLKEFKEFQKYKNESKYPSDLPTQEEINEIINPKDEELNLLSESKELLKAASLSSDGLIHYLKYIGGVKLVTNNKDFIESQERREVVKWEEALNELQSKELIIEESKSKSGTLYKITNHGFELADKIVLDKK